MELSRIKRYKVGNDETLTNLRTKPRIWEHIFMPTIICLIPYSLQKVMGNHTNFYLLILSLLRLKDELYRIEMPRLQTLIQLLNSKFITIEDGCEKIPSNKELAAELGIPVTQCNSLLKLLMQKIWADFEFNKPLKIENVVHNIIIMLHWEEWEKSKSNKEVPSTLSINLKLIEIPRIGEEIEFEIIPGNHFERGIVQSVTHSIKGKTQHVEIIAHPFETDYDRWMELKGKYEKRQRWLKQLK